MKRRYKFDDVMFGESPNLYSLLLLWVWKQNAYIKVISVIFIVILQLGLPMVWMYFLGKELSFIAAFPLFLYLFIGVWLKYFTESSDKARDIYAWREKIMKKTKNTNKEMI